MKFTLAWLKDHLDTSADVARIAETLTAIGLEVEAVEDRAAGLAAFIVAEIVEAAPHSNASKLQICKVNDGAGLRQVVCGAANARSGLKVVLAREGVKIPGNGMVIKKAEIRGVESNGMLCSAQELGLAEASEGIIELPASAQPGAPAVAALGADNPVIEIAITPNRADALGVRGIARDLAAAGLGTLKPLAIPAIPAGAPSPITVSIETPETCPLFIGYYLKGVRGGDSPEWLTRRLTAIGQKPISVLVDITNYFTHTFARPLHVFDAKKLSGSLTVRRAREGERLSALNGKEYALTPAMTVIADAHGPQALGGVIGGAETGVSAETTEVFLEAALFDPVNIAETGRALELQTDARYRFERGVDAGFVADGAKLAVQMILDLCGGQASAPVVAGAAPDAKRTIAFHPSIVNKLGGVALDENEIKNILSKLGFELNVSRETFLLTVPSFRQDINGEADIVEEILRIHGYAHIPSTPLPKPPGIGAPALSPRQKRAGHARRTLAARGMLEAVTWSFIPQAQAEAFGGGDAALALKNPISTDLSAMRPSLLPNLLSAAADNARRDMADLALFEVGPCFHGITPEGQRAVAGGIRAGAAVAHQYADGNFQRTAREADCFDAKADALSVLAALGLKPESVAVTKTVPAWYHPGRSGALTLGKTVLGHFGELHPAVAQQFGLEGRVAAFEIALDAAPLPKARGKARPSLKVSDFQAVTRDFAFTVDTAVPAAEMLRSISGADGLITEAQLFDVYSGKGVEDGRKSMAVRVTLQAMDRTLSEAEINAAAQAVVQAAAGAFGAVLRQ